MRIALIPMKDLASAKMRLADVLDRNERAELALAMLEDLETFDRGRYAGPVGWVDAHGDGEWAVALRCAELEGSTARLVAGAGVVAGSDPDAEWAETQAKLEPMLRVLVQP